MNIDPNALSSMCAGYRIFVSYSHDDAAEFQALKAALEKQRFCVLSDRNIGAGAPFTDAIKGLISHAHLFIPLITKNAQTKPWVHQETGFAMARNIPILPVVLEDAGMPSEMIAQLHAVEVDETFSGLESHLNPETIGKLIFPRPAPLTEMVRIAEWPEERTQLLVESARRVMDLGYAGLFRQRGALSSFCIPDADSSDEIWQRREGAVPHSEYYRHLLRDERRALEWHARRAGCRLIIEPAVAFKDRGLKETLARLETLLAFLTSAEDCQIEIVLSPHALEGNLTLVGDWFVAESLIPRRGGYIQTIFNWHSPTVSRWVRRFDEQFNELCRNHNQDPSHSRKFAVQRLTAIYREYRKEDRRRFRVSRSANRPVLRT